MCIYIPDALAGALERKTGKPLSRLVWRIVMESLSRHEDEEIKTLAKAELIKAGVE